MSFKTFLATFLRHFLILIASEVVIPVMFWGWGIVEDGQAVSAHVPLYNMGQKQAKNNPKVMTANCLEKNGSTVGIKNFLCFFQC